MGQLFRGQRLDARQSAHGHEDRRVNDAVRRRELAETRSTVGLEETKLSPQSSALSPGYCSFICSTRTVGGRASTALFRSGKYVVIIPLAMSMVTRFGES